MGPIPLDQVEAIVTAARMQPLTGKRLKIPFAHDLACPRQRRPSPRFPHLRSGLLVQAGSPG